MSHPTTPTPSSGASTPGEDWIPRDDMAAMARTSVDTVKRDIKKHQLITRTDAEGRVLVDVADFLRIGRLRPEDLTHGATPAESAQVIRARETITALKTEVAEQSGRLVQADFVITTLREQLTVKDRQLAAQAAQLTQLTTLIGRLGQVGGAA